MMIEHLRGREKALEPFGWTGREAEWIALVCLHSGVFTRSQFCRFCSPTVVDRKRALRFVRDLVGRGVAAEDDRRIFPGSAKACRIFSQEIYRKLGIENLRHSREAHTAVLLRRLLSLDYVLEHLELPWLPTEQEKVEFFESLGIPRKLLPSRLYQGAVNKQTRYFPLKLPIAVDAKTATFAYVDPGNDTDTELRSWGKAHRHLWGALRKKGRAVHVVAIGPNHTATMRAGTALRRWVRATPEATQIPEGLERDDPAAARAVAEIIRIEQALLTGDRRVYAEYGNFNGAVARLIALRRRVQVSRDDPPVVAEMRQLEQAIGNVDIRFMAKYGGVNGASKRLVTLLKLPSAESIESTTVISISSFETWVTRRLWGPNSAL